MVPFLTLPIYKRKMGLVKTSEKDSQAAKITCKIRDCGEEALCMISTKEIAEYICYNSLSEYKKLLPIRCQHLSPFFE